MVGTHIEFDSDKQHIELRKRALDLGINLRQLMINGAIDYKPKKDDPQGMELFMDICDIPKDFYNKKQWNKHIAKLGNNKKLKEQVVWLAGKLKI